MIWGGELVKRFVRFGLLLWVIALSGYAAEPPGHSFATSWQATLVTAEGSSKPGEIRNVSGYFTFSQRIHAHLTLVAKQPSGVIPGKHRFSFKWFNGNTLVHERSGTQSIAKSPHYLLHAVPASVLGVGECRIEVHSGNELLAVRAFSVSEQ